MMTGVVVNDSQINIRNIVGTQSAVVPDVVNDSQINIRNIAGAVVDLVYEVVNDSHIIIRNIVKKLAMSWPVL